MIVSVIILVIRFVFDWIKLVIVIFDFVFIKINVRGIIVKWDKILFKVSYFIFFFFLNS